MSKVTLVAAFVALSVFVIAVGARRSRTLSQLRATRWTREYESACVVDAGVRREMFRRALRGEWHAEALRSGCAALGLLPITIEGRDSRELLVLCEDSRRLSGRGLFVFRKGEVAPVAIEAPHSSKDLHTGDIAERLFEESHAAAAAWNTAPRTAQTSTRSDAPAADVAHLPDSLFQSFTLAFADIHPDGKIIQIHGFATEKRRTEQARRADVVLSDGTRTARGDVLQIEECLERAGASVALYPAETDELGGTTNLQAKALRAMGHSGFRHIELSLEFRHRLVTTKSLRKDLLTCLLAEW